MSADVTAARASRAVSANRRLVWWTLALAVVAGIRLNRKYLPKSRPGAAVATTG